MAQQSSPAQSSRANAGALNRFKHAMISQFKAKSCTSCHKLQAQVISLSSEVSLSQQGLNKPLTFSCKHTEQKLDWQAATGDLSRFDIDFLILFFFVPFIRFPTS